MSDGEDVYRFHLDLDGARRGSGVNRAVISDDPYFWVGLGGRILRYGDEDNAISFVALYPRDAGGAICIDPLPYPPFRGGGVTSYAPAPAPARDTLAPPADVTEEEYLAAVRARIRAAAAWRDDPVVFIGAGGEVPTPAEGGTSGP